MADIYDETRRLPSEVVKKLTTTLSIELSDCKKILDVGVGTGRLAAPLQDAGFEVVGIDISRRMESRAREKGVKQLLLADARFLPIKPKAFEASTCVHVLHLITEWKKALQEMCRVTRSVIVSLYETHENSVQEYYWKMLQRHGYERHRPGISEHELQGLSKLAKSLFVSSYDVHADDRLNSLERRANSSQWEIPEALNFNIVKELKTKFAGKIFKQELFLLMWDVKVFENLYG